MRAFDAQTGKEIWHSESLENHIASGITGTPVVSGDQIFVPLSSGEEVVAMQPNYSCCTFRGSLAALDLKTGQKQWQTFMITEPLLPTRMNANGVQMQGPAGAPIWASPTVDPKRGLVYVVTGDSYTDAATEGDDAIVALEMKTGKVRWRNQVTTHDNFIVGCGGPVKPANCPTPTGPDFDFGAAPILFKHGSKQVLVAGQKSGIVYGIDPVNGRTLWKTAVGAGSPLGGVEWGIGADKKYVFVPNSDIGQIFDEIAIAAGTKTSPEYTVPGVAGPYRRLILSQARSSGTRRPPALLVTTPETGRRTTRRALACARNRRRRQSCPMSSSPAPWTAGFGPTTPRAAGLCGNSAPLRRPTARSTAIKLSRAAG